MVPNSSVGATYEVDFIKWLMKENPYFFVTELKLQVRMSTPLMVEASQLKKKIGELGWSCP